MKGSDKWYSRLSWLFNWEWHQGHIYSLASGFLCGTAAGFFVGMIMYAVLFMSRKAGVGAGEIFILILGAAFVVVALTGLTLFLFHGWRNVGLILKSLTFRVAALVGFLSGALAMLIGGIGG